MEKNKTNIKNIALGILIAIVGILVMIFPRYSIDVVVILLGIAAIISGIYNLLKFYKVSDNLGFKKIILIKSITSIVLGVLAVVLPFAFIKVIETIVKVLLYVEAVYLLLSAFAEILIIEKLKENNENLKTLRFEILSSILAAILLFLLAPNFGEIVVRILGAILTAGGIIYVIYYYLHKPIVVEAENVHDVNEDETSSQNENPQENQSEKTENAEN